MSFFISFEGIEGCGKTTQMKLLQKHLQGQGYAVVSTREPGGCSIADSIRTLLLDPANAEMTSQTELLLYEAARSQHIAELIRPALDNGKVVLCDRFSDATFVYQGAGRGIDSGQLEIINLFSTSGLTPDLTLLLDFPVDAGLMRARARNLDDNLESEGRFELESLNFHQRIRQGYLKRAEQNGRFHTIDATGTTEDVSLRIITVVDAFLDGRRSA